jgi:hypothetical protein
MSRIVHVDVQVHLVLSIDEGIEVGEVIDEMEYHFRDTTTQANIVDTEILDYEVVDSK